MLGGRFTIRRAIALAGVLAAGAAGALVGQPAPEPATAGDTHGVRVVHYTLDSALTHRTLRQTLLLPPGGRAAGRPLLVFLHARGDTNRTYLRPQLFAALARLGDRAPVVVLPEGGKRSFWHDRAGAAWGAYVLREVVPEALARSGADGRRLALGGISMGGFGALDLLRNTPGRFCAVGAHSPGIPTGYARRLPGAFDDRRDFDRNDLLRLVGERPAAFGGTPLWLDVGDRDPFRPAVVAFAGALRGAGLPVTLRVWPGRHAGWYWRRHWTSYLGFYARALAACEPDRGLLDEAPRQVRGEQRQRRHDQQA